MLYELDAYLDGSADANLRGRVATHAEECPNCRSLLEDLAAAVPAASLTNKDSVGGGVGPAVVEALAGGDDVPDVASGQVWRILWDDHAALVVVVTRNDPSTILAVPLSEDVQFATDFDLVLDKTEFVRGLSYMAQVPLEMVVSVRVLEHCLGRIATSALDDLVSLRKAFTQSVASGLPLGRVGPPVTSELDERLAFRSAQRELHGMFPFAAWYEQPRDQASAAALVESAMSAEKLTPMQLAARSNIDIAKVMDLLHGTSPVLEPERMTALASVLGLEPTLLQTALAPSFPLHLVGALDQPRAKALVLRFARERETSEAEVRATMARELCSAAKRATELGVEEWLNLLLQRFGR